MWVWLLAVLAVVSGVNSAGAGAARLICYVESARGTNDFSECTHLVYAGNARGEKLETLLKDYRKHNARLKIVLRTNEVDKDLSSLLKSKHIQGLELFEAHKTLNKTKVLDLVTAARTALTSSGGGPLFLALPAHPELLAKYYDLRSLVKKVDLMMVETHALGVVKKMTYHPSRLSGMWDMMNTDSVVDLVTGLGVPTSKVVISLPATARQFILVNETLSTPGSPTEEEEPKEIDQAELCRQLQRGRWTLERDQDLSAPYAFNNKTWISFEDSSSIDVKGKYARVRGLAGLALHHAEKDTESSCGPTLKAALAKVLNQQSRAPRAAVLRSLEHEILSAPGYGRALDALQVSPYRITQVVDSDGVIHSIREDTRTEFSCSRQGYFVHPRSCARFYRCVKFDQLSPEYTVFEFDCPAGLAFDSRYEVCVWPGSLAHSQACPGSSEIAPVPHTRFICPEHEGYYADPENCRWFFACLDHGKSPLTAYEFRCPFGLGFDAEQLKCDWPWKVPACGNIARYEAQVHGFSGATLTGAVGYQGQTADAINVAAHQSLVSGASLNNLVGVQGGFLTKEDALDSNFIASQQLANAGNFGNGLSNQGLSQQAYQDISLIQPTNYRQPEYSSGSLILDDYRLPTNQESIRKGAIGQANVNIQNGNSGAQSYTGYTLGQKTAQYSTNYDDNSGAYVHDPSGDYAEPYRHVDSPVQPYLHQGSQYKQSSDYYDVGKYSGQNYQYTSGSQNGYEGKYKDDNSGQYVEDNSGAYIDSGNSYAGSYGQDDSGKYQGVYRADGHIGEGKTSSNFQQYNQYSAANAGNYINDAKAYTGGSHTLTAGAINVGLVGKTTLVDAEYNNQNAYKGNGYSHSTFHVSQPAVAINHVGTDFNNLDGYSFVTTPTSSGIPTTATPFAVTTALPTVTYKTTFVPEPAKTSIKQIFGVSQPAVTYVQPTVAVKQVPQVYLTENQGSYQETKDSGYQYSKPSISFEDSISYTTAAPAVSTYKPSFSQQTVHQVSSGFGYSTPSPVYEEPFKKLVAYTTGPSISTYDAPTVATYTPQAFSHQTIHKVESNSAYTPTVQSGYVYEEPKIQYTTARPELAIGSVTPQVISHQTLHKVDASKINSYSEESGYNYEKPAVQFEEVKTVYSTPAPIVASYKPQSYSQQTIHKVEAQQYVPTPKYEVQYQSTPVTYYKNPILEYTEKAAPVTYVQPTYKSQAISHQTIHKVENSNVNLASGYQYNQPSVVQYTTPQPIVVSSTYEPQVYSHQTVHKVENANVNLGSGYEYSKPVVKYEQPSVVQYTTPQPTVVSSTYEPQVYSHQTLHKVENANVNLGSGYQYNKPVVTYEQPSVVQYTTPQPAVVSSTYEPQVFSQQTLHKVEQANVNLGSGYEYSKPVVKYEQPSVVQYTTPQPAVVSSTYEPQVYSHQTLHKVENANVNLGSGYQYNKPEVRYEQPSVVQYTTPQPIVVSSTYEPQVFSQQTVHKVDASQVKTYQESNQGYEYKQPAIKFVETPKVFEYSTPTPIVTSTYKPQIYSQQTVHKVETQKYIPVSTPAPVYQPAVTRYENPLLKYTQKVTYVQPTVPVFTQTYKPIVQQQQITHSLPIQEHISQEGYSYSQPEIQRNFEGSNGFSDASVVSHQTFHQANVNSYQNKNVILSTVPSTLVYEDHYVETPKVEYKAPEYIPPKNDYKSYSYVSSTAAPVVHQSSIVHQAPTYLPPKTDYQYSVSSTASTPIQQETYDYSQYETVQKSVPSVQQVSFSTSHIEQPQKVESIHFSFPSSTPNYQQVEYQAPEIQVGYKAEEYLPPVVSTQAPVVTSTYRPRTYSTTTREYLPPVETKYEYLPPSTTARPIVKTTPIYTESTTYKADEYLPPDFGAKVVNYETYNTEAPRIKYNPYRDYSYSQNRKQNIVVQTAKANQLGFGTVGPDAGLVSPVTYTTAAPIVTSTYRQRVKSTTPAYRYKSTTYKAPEYLPPDDSQLDIENYEYNKESSKIKYNPYQDDIVTAVPRKQNIVLETSKSNLLGFGTVGPDAGLVSSAYTTAGPVVVSSTESYSLSPKTESYAPVEQGLYEVTSPAPRRRTKPKVAVVTKLNDFNPFLVRKLGAVCSCQSPVLILRGKKPAQVPQQDFSDFNDYDDAIRGDVQDNEYAQRLTKIQSPISVKTVSTPAPYVSSTFNPIIVPDDSYYQDLQEQNNYEVDVTPKQKQVYSENYVSSTPYAASTTEKYVRVRQRVKAVTPAPTYETILLNKDVTPTITIKDSESAAVDSQSFDRYGPGGWRSRDETLQGSVDCQRAGLFRHPKQCNKFYACRWDCTKQRFTLHVFNCPIQLSFDPKIGACNWPSQGPACQGDTLLTNVL